MQQQQRDPVDMRASRLGCIVGRAGQGRLGDWAFKWLIHDVSIKPGQTGQSNVCGTAVPAVVLYVKQIAALTGMVCMSTCSNLHVQ